MPLGKAGRRMWAAARTASLQALPFPFDQYRGGQRAMAAAAYRTFRDGGRLLCQAPTGISKPMSALFPALKAMGEAGASAFFTSPPAPPPVPPPSRPLAALRAAQPRLSLKSITLTAKDKACLLEKRECTPDACPYASGYYDRIRNVLWRALDETEFTRPLLEELAARFQVCPFELGAGPLALVRCDRGRLQLSL